MGKNKNKNKNKSKKAQKAQDAEDMKFLDDVAEENKAKIQEALEADNIKKLRKNAQEAKRNAIMKPNRHKIHYENMYCEYMLGLAKLTTLDMQEKISVIRAKKIGLKIGPDAPMAWDNIFETQIKKNGFYYVYNNYDISNDVMKINNFTNAEKEDFLQQSFQFDDDEYEYPEYNDTEIEERSKISNNQKKKEENKINKMLRDADTADAFFDSLDDQESQEGHMLSEALQAQFKQTTILKKKELDPALPEIVQGLLDNFTKNYVEYAAENKDKVNVDNCQDNKASEKYIQEEQNRSEDTIKSIKHRKQEKEELKKLEIKPETQNSPKGNNITLDTTTSSLRQKKSNINKNSQELEDNEESKFQAQKVSKRNISDWGQKKGNINKNLQKLEDNEELKGRVKLKGVGSSSIIKVSSKHSITHARIGAGKSIQRKNSVSDGNNNILFSSITNPGKHDNIKTFKKRAKSAISSQWLPINRINEIAAKNVQNSELSK